MHAQISSAAEAAGILPRGWVTAYAVSSDGHHVVSASWDHTLKIWELASGRAVATQGHTGWTTACAMTPDGRHVVSASN